MLKPEKTIIPLVATALLACSSFSAAAIFEIGRPPLDASSGEIRLLSGGATEGPYQRVRIRQFAGNQAFFSLHALAVSPEDLLWIAIGDTGLPGFNASTFNVHTPSYLFELDTGIPTIRRTGREAASSVRVDRTAPKVWVMLMIGAGLIWFQLRRKVRHHAIRFFPP